MSDDDPSRLARLEQRVDDFERTLAGIAPVVTAVAELNVELRHMVQAIAHVNADVSEIKESLKERDEAVSAERKSTRTALYSLVGVLVAALISGGAAIVVALISGA